MSVCIDYFFDYDGTLEDLTEQINRYIGCSLSPLDDDTTYMFARLFSLELSLLEDHGLENDRDLDFENFRFRIGIKTWLPDALLRKIQLATIASIVYTIFVQMRITGMLVYEFGRLLARYEERDTNLFGDITPENLDLFAIGDMSRWIYDTGSGEPILNFSRHLQLLEARMNA